MNSPKKISTPLNSFFRTFQSHLKVFLRGLTLLSCHGDRSWSWSCDARVELRSGNNVVVYGFTSAPRFIRTAPNMVGVKAPERPLHRTCCSCIYKQSFYGIQCRKWTHDCSYCCCVDMLLSLCGQSRLGVSPDVLSWMKTRPQKSCFCHPHFRVWMIITAG